MAPERPDPLRVLAAQFRASKAGRTGGSGGDFTLDYKKALAEFGSAAEQIEAEELLRRAAASSDGLLQLETHPRDASLIHLIRLGRKGGEEWLFAQLGEPSPTQRRTALAALFDSFRGSTLPDDWLANLSHQALIGGSIEPFKRDDFEGNRELLTVLTRVLAWKGESLIRFASCIICRDSKRLETLQSRLEAALRQINGQTFEDLGLLEKPRRVTVRGPLRLKLATGEIDLGLLQAPVTLSELDLTEAAALECDAARVMTVENETTFLELAKSHRDTLLVLTSYPGRAVLKLLERLPEHLPSFHFGDSDPAGFDILRDLRERSGRSFQPLHMGFREAPGAPPLTSEERRMLQRLLDHPLLADVHEELRRMDAAGTKGQFEQEFLGRVAVA